MRPGFVPLEWEEAAAVALAAAAVEDIVEADDVEVMVAVLEEIEVGEAVLVELVVVGLARLGKELEEADNSDVVVSFEVFVDFEDFEFELVLASAELGGVDVGVAVVLSLEPSGIVAVTGPRSIVIPL